MKKVIITIAILVLATMVFAGNDCTTCPTKKVETVKTETMDNFIAKELEKEVVYNPSEYIKAEEQRDSIQKTEDELLNFLEEQIIYRAPKNID